MRSAEIHWHDSIIVRVVELPTVSVAFQIEYPEDWERDIYVNKTVLIGEIFSYQIHEGPFVGPITILGATEATGADDSRLIRIETNAGYRELRFKTLDLLDEHVTGLSGHQ